MKKRFTTVFIIALVFIALFGLRVINRNKNKYIYVKTAPVTKGDIQSYISTTAQIKSKEVKQHYAIQGKVTKVNVSVGDKVKKGDVLVTYDVQDLNGTVKQAEIQYNNAVLQKQDLVDSNKEIKSKIADIDKSIKEYDGKIEDLKKSKDPESLAKIQSLEQGRTQLKQQKEALKPISDTKLKQAQNAIDTAKLNLDQAKANLDKLANTLTAEIDGTVTVVNAIEGSTGNPAQMVVEIQNLDSLEALVQAGKYDVFKLSVDQSAQIKNGSNIYKGVVSKIDPIAVNTVTSSGQDTLVPIHVDVLDKNTNLVVNFITDIDILVGEEKDVIKVPIESVKSDKDGKKYVYVLEGEKAVRKNITVGLQADMDITVKEGLEVGERVILNPDSSINEKTLIKEGERPIRNRGGFGGARS